MCHRLTPQSHLGSGDVSLATLDTRLRIVERVTFGAVALVLTGVIVAGLCLIVGS